MRVGVIGYGQFAQFAIPLVSKLSEVIAYDIAGGEGTKTLQEVCSTDLVVFAVPAQAFDAACAAAQQFIQPTTLIADISSVKVGPIAMMRKYFLNNEILGTHPIFGPQSGKDGIVGLPIVLFNVSWTESHYAACKDFLGGTLKLHVIEQSAEQHDKEMARVQGLTHFIGRALGSIDMTAYPTSTKSYTHLLELVELLKNDSWDLFRTIQMENPYAENVRKEFLAELHDLEEKLKRDV
ncbi:MAG: prephenate dehydrogenase/arogenate dehydrogenase family protein [Patescibacteria group bacterium]